MGRIKIERKDPPIDKAEEVIRGSRIIKKLLKEGVKYEDIKAEISHNNSLVSVEIDIGGPIITAQANLEEDDGNNNEFYAFHMKYYVIDRFDIKYEIKICSLLEEENLVKYLKNIHNKLVEMLKLERENKA